MATESPTRNPDYTILRPGPLNPLIQVDSRLPDHPFERSFAIRPVSKIDVDEHIRLIVLTALNPSLVRSSQFLGEPKASCPHEVRNIAIRPVV